MAWTGRLMACLVLVDARLVRHVEHVDDLSSDPPSLGHVVAIRACPHSRIGPPCLPAAFPPRTSLQWCTMFEHLAPKRTRRCGQQTARSAHLAESARGASQALARKDRAQRESPRAGLVPLAIWSRAQFPWATTALLLVNFSSVLTALSSVLLSRSPALACAHVTPSDINIALRPVRAPPASEAD